MADGVFFKGDPDLLKTLKLLSLLFVKFVCFHCHLMDLHLKISKYWKWIHLNLYNCNYNSLYIYITCPCKTGIGLGRTVGSNRRGGDLRRSSEGGRRSVGGRCGAGSSSSWSLLNVMCSGQRTLSQFTRSYWVQWTAMMLNSACYWPNYDITSWCSVTMSA